MEQVQAAIKAGADVNGKDKGGLTPLMGAVAWNGNPEIIAVWIKVGVDTNAKNSDGKTALDYAREKNDSRVVEILIKAGAK